MSHLKVVKCQGTSEKGKEERRMWWGVNMVKGHYVCIKPTKNY
jgi:hypothetical protein